MESVIFFHEKRTPRRWFSSSKTTITFLVPLWYNLTVGNTWYLPLLRTCTYSRYTVASNHFRRKRRTVAFTALNLKRALRSFFFLKCRDFYFRGVNHYESSVCQEVSIFKGITSFTWSVCSRSLTYFKDCICTIQYKNIHMVEFSNVELAF